MRFSILLGLAISGLFGQSKQYEIRQPKGTWQVPGEIRQPKGPWQVPKGIQAIREQKAKCEDRLAVVADALFEFDQFALRADAVETLKALGPKVKERAGDRKVVIEGHTDAVGADAYNQQLSEKRASAVRDWLVSGGYLSASRARVAGFGKKRPVAANAKADGSDNPEGRERNRRVEVVVETCP